MAATLPKAAPFRREHTGDAAMDRVQRAAQVVTQAHEQTKAYVAANVAASIAPLGGQFLRNVSINTIGTSVPHTLGRVPVGYVITRSRSLSTPGANYQLSDNGAHTATALNVIVGCTTAGVQALNLDLYIF